MKRPSFKHFCPIVIVQISGLVFCISIYMQITANLMSWSTMDTWPSWSKAVDSSPTLVRGMRSNRIVFKKALLFELLFQWHFVALSALPLFWILETMHARGSVDHQITGPRTISNTLLHSV